MDRLKWGLVFICGALLCGLVGLVSSIRAANRVRRLAPISAAALEDAPPGEQILVEGHVSSRNLALSHGFVAYVREWRQVDENRDTGSWTVSARMTPPLVLELPDGLAQVGNDDYDLENAHIVEEEETFDEPRSVRQRGLSAGDPVIALGVVAAGSEPPQIEADFVARGTRSDYLARRRWGGVLFCALSIPVAAAGGVVLMWDRVARLVFRRR
jgi:hypothetical protein